MIIALLIIQYFDKTLVNALIGAFICKDTFAVAKPFLYHAKCYNYYDKNE